MRCETRTEAECMARTGTSFATLPPAQIIFSTLYADGTCPSSVVNGVTVKGPCPEAYGMLIGTMALCSLTSIGLSFLPTRQLKKIFPPVVTGTVICLIGISLIGSSGVLNWGGGESYLDMSRSYSPLSVLVMTAKQAPIVKEDQPVSSPYVLISRRQSQSHSDRRR